MRVGDRAGDRLPEALEEGTFSNPGTMFVRERVSGRGWSSLIGMSQVAGTRRRTVLAGQTMSLAGTTNMGEEIGTLREAVGGRRGTRNVARDALPDAVCRDTTPAINAIWAAQ